MSTSTTPRGGAPRRPAGPRARIAGAPSHSDLAAQSREQNERQQRVQDEPRHALGRPREDREAADEHPERESAPGRGPPEDGDDPDSAEDDDRPLVRRQAATR